MIALVSCDLSGSIEISMHEFRSARMTNNECDVEVVAMRIGKISRRKFASRHRAVTILLSVFPVLWLKAQVYLLKAEVRARTDGGTM